MREKLTDRKNYFPTKMAFLMKYVICSFRCSIKTERGFPFQILLANRCVHIRHSENSVMVLKVIPFYSAGMFPAVFLLYVFTLVKKEKVFLSTLKGELKPCAKCSFSNFVMG